MLTFQDFELASDKKKFIARAISEHLLSDTYIKATTADAYDHQKNTTILNYVKTIFTLSGSPVEDFTASNNKLCSNFFHRLNTQRCTYLLGNGVSFTDHKDKVKNGDGVEVTVDRTKEKLGIKFDTMLKKIGYKALIHGVCYGFWNLDKLHMFPVTEFVPLLDEYTGALRAGIRFWKLSSNKPMIAVLYEEDGYTKYQTISKQNDGSLSDVIYDNNKYSSNDYDFEEIEPKRAYITKYVHTDAGGDVIVGEENYGSLPIVPFYGSDLKQSTIVGMREQIDSFDLIRSGFANDLNDCAQIYWIIENCGGMSDRDLARFRDRLKINHIAVADRSGDAKATPFVQDIPYQARKEYLDEIRAGIYEDFGGLDVHTIAAGATNDHIDAAYQPMDEEADDFEYQACEFIQQVLALMGIEDTPVFKRNRISNEKEQVEMVMMEANYLDDETILSKLPNITPDEISYILARKDMQDAERFETGKEDGVKEGEETEEGETEEAEESPEKTPF
jgi:hypothetical protein